jgi:glycosyltransferase involved in cell wall biosynthesis
MKILYITNGINGVGGLERVLSVKASYLAEHYNYEITILSLNDNHLNSFYTFSDKIKMLSIPVAGNPIQYLLSYKKGIQEIVKQLKPDVISVCDDGLKGFFVPTLLESTIPVIYERHASIAFNTTKTIYGKIVRFFMQKLAEKFDCFVVLTASNVLEWNAKNIKVISNPLTFYPVESSALKQKLVIAVGSHSENKGYDLLLEAWTIVVSKYPEWQLHVYGKIDKDRFYLRLAKKIGVDNTVTFHNPVADIQQMYLNSAIMVMSSRSEGFGMVLIEAMACGVPCVSFDCASGPRDIIKDTVDGYLVPAENIEALALKIMDLMEDDQKRKEFGLSAKENVKRFLPEAIVQQWDELFKAIVS